MRPTELVCLSMTLLCREDFALSKLSAATSGFVTAHAMTLLVSATSVELMLLELDALREKNLNEQELSPDEIEMVAGGWDSTTETNLRNDFSTYISHVLERGTFEEWVERRGWTAERQAWIDAGRPSHPGATGGLPQYD